MNILTKSILTSLLPCAAVSAQGLYSIAPNDDEAGSSLPLTYIVGASIGYDDNPTPLSNVSNGSVFIEPYVQANWVNVSPQTTWDLYARLGVRFYFQDVEVGDGDQTTFNVRVGANYTHRFSERLRFSSRNFVGYETEPDFTSGFGGDRSSNYFRYTTDNSIGYRWTDRLGTQTGISFSGVDFDDFEDSDYNQFTLRHSFRYRVSPATVLTASYRYTSTFSDTNSGDSSSHFVTGGVEHRINPLSAIVLRAGVQITDPDNGSGRTRPFVEAALRSSLTSQLSTRVFVRWSNETFNRSLTDGGGVVNTFERSDTLRIGARATYALNPRVSLFGGVNYIRTGYDDPVNAVSVEGDEDLWNLNVGASYQLTDNLFLNGSYNYSESISDFDREYDRNRFQLGVQATF